MQQDQDIASAANSNAVPLCGKSWIAYLGAFIQLVVALSLLAAVLVWHHEWWPAITVTGLIAMSFIVYRWRLLSSVRLYYDDIGVWIYSGVLPWKRGLSGVKWRDLDEAVFTNSFWSWLSGSYTVQVRHRFTKANEIDENNMAHGKQAVITINQQQQQRIRQGLPM